jgi:hypothetical protein
MDEQGGIEGCLPTCPERSIRRARDGTLSVSINYGNTLFFVSVEVVLSWISFLADLADLSTDHPSCFVDDD